MNPDTENPLSFEKQIETLFHQKNYIQLIESCQNRPITIKSRFFLASSLNESKQKERAIGEFEAVLQAAPEQIAVVKNLCLLYRETGRTDSLISLCSRFEDNHTGAILFNLACEFLFQKNCHLDLILLCKRRFSSFPLSRSLILWHDFLLSCLKIKDHTSIDWFLSIFGSLFISGFELIKIAQSFKEANLFAFAIRILQKKEKELEFHQRVFLADLLILHLEPKQALAILDLEPLNHFRIACLRARAFLTLKEPEKALRALFLCPLDEQQEHDFLAILSQIYQEQGKIQSSMEILHRLNQSDENHIYACLELAKTRMVDRDLALDWENLISKNLLPSSDCYRLCMALGTYFENEKDVEKSWHYYSLGKSLHQRDFDFSAYLAFLQTTEKAISSCQIRVFDNPSVRETNSLERMIFIVGAPRCGSTHLENLLCSHEKFFSIGEIPWFSRCVHRNLKKHSLSYPADLGKITPDIYEEISSCYLQKISDFMPQRFWIDKLLNNFFLTGILCNSFPNAKIIHLKRDPLATCFSIFKNYFTTDYRFSRSLEETAIFYNYYRKIMEKWKKRFEKKILEIDYENLVLERTNSMTEIFSFLNIEPKIKKDPEFLTSTLSLFDLKKEIKTPNESVKLFEPFLQPLKNLLEVS